MWQLEGDPISDDAGNGSGEDSHPVGQIARWLLALAVAVGGAGYYLQGIGGQIVCEDSLSPVAGEIVHLCGPPSLADLVPFALVIGVLLAPDLNELGIPGLLSVKRRIKRQELKQENLEGQIIQLEHRIEQRVEQNQTSSLQVTNIVEAGRQLEEKLGAIHDAVVVGDKEPPVADKEPEAPPSSEEDERASLIMQLLYLSKNLEQYEAISRLRRVDQGERMAALTEDQQERVDRWYSLFEGEIGAVKQVRNVAAHRPHAPTIEELREATRIGRRLLRILLRGLGLGTEAIDRFEEGRAPS